MTTCLITVAGIVQINGRKVDGDPGSGATGQRKRDHQGQQFVQPACRHFSDIGWRMDLSLDGGQWVGVPEERSANR